MIATLWANLAALPSKVDWRLADTLYRSRFAQAVSLIPVLGYVLIYSNATRHLVEDLLKFDLALPSGGFLAWNTKLNLLYGGSLLILAGWIVFQLFCPSLVKNFPRPHDLWRHAIQIMSFRIVDDAIDAAFNQKQDGSAEVVSPEIYRRLVDLVASLKDAVEHNFRDRLSKLASALERSLGQGSIDKQHFEDAKNYLSLNRFFIFEKIEMRDSLTALLSAHHEHEAKSALWLARASNLLGWTGAFVFALPSLDVGIQATRLLLRI